MLKGEKLAQDILDDIFSVVTAANYPGTTIAAVAASSFDLDNVLELRRLCSEDDWPMGGRSLLLDSGHAEYLLKDSRLGLANAGSTAPVREGGFGRRIAGFDPYEVPRLPDNAENLVGMAVFPSSIFVAFSPIQPAPAVRHQLAQYQVVTDPDSQLAIEYRVWGEPITDKQMEVIECNYGYAVGEPAALKRIASACGPSLRTAVTIARKHDAKEWELVLGPDTPVAEHRSRLKLARADVTSAFAEIQLWESGAGCGRDGTPGWMATPAKPACPSHHEEHREHEGSESEASEPVPQQLHVEVHQEPDPSPAEPEVRQELSLMDPENRLHGLQFYDQGVLDHQVDAVAAVQPDALVLDRQGPLNLVGDSGPGQFVGEALLVTGLQEPRPKDTVDLQGTADHPVRQRIEVHRQPSLPGRETHPSLPLQRIPALPTLRVLGVLRGETASWIDALPSPRSNSGNPELEIGIAIVIEENASVCRAEGALNIPAEKALRLVRKAVLGKRHESSPKVALRHADPPFRNFGTQNGVQRVVAMFALDSPVMPA